MNSKIINIIAGLALLAMMIHVTADVALKYLFNSPIPLTIELVSNYYMIMVVLLPLAIQEDKDKSLIHVELVYEHLPRKFASTLLRLTQIISSLYCFTIALSTIPYAMRHYRSGSYEGTGYYITTWPSYFLPIIGFGLLAIALFLKAIFPKKSD